MALNMGFRVEMYLSIEKYALTRAVAKAIYSQIAHISPHDSMEIDISRLVERIAELQISKIILTSGCPCTPWSRLSTNPLGFSHPLAQLVMKTAELLDALRSRNFIWKVLNKKVAPHKQLYQDIGRLEKMMRMDYFMHNAVHCGAVASRPRLFVFEGAEVSKILAVSHFNPDFVLDNGWHFTKRQVPCLHSYSGHCH
jgi:site-specific DNA-cytosine methylase